MLILTRRVNQKIMVGEEISITILDLKGRQVVIGIDAPLSIKILREEVAERDKEEKGVVG